MVEVFIIFLIIIALMILGVPIGFAFAAGGLYLLLSFGIDPLWATMQGLSLISAFVLLAAPLYVLLGAIICKAGIAQRLIDVINSIIRMASLGGLGQAFLPVMEKEGYSAAYAISVLIPSSVLSLLIPPSGNAIMFGFLGRLSIARCFLTGIGPGLLLMTFLSLIHLIIYPKYCPNMTEPSRESIKNQFKIAGKSIWKNILTLAIPVIVLGVIYGGIATPTESAAVGVCYCLILGLFIYRTIKINEVGKILFDASKLIGSILLLVFFFLVMSRVLIIEQVSEQLLALIMQYTTNKYGIVLLISLLIFFLGMIVDDGSVVIISAILFLPIAKKIGFDPYHFGVITILLSGCGLITPPVAPLLYLGGHMAGDIPLRTFAAPVFIFLFAAFIPTLLLVIYFPEIALLLPRLIMG